MSKFEVKPVNLKVQSVELEHHAKQLNVCKNEIEEVKNNLDSAYADMIPALTILEVTIEKDSRKVGTLANSLKEISEEYSKTEKRIFR
ncbi:MAG: hypothetical protein K5739_01790 [Lachnospiraceae bacterium]|nr:hypothetical protein [Lachnospiraceae bacterium]